MCNIIKTIIKEAARATTGVRKSSKNNKWLDDECPNQFEA